MIIIFKDGVSEECHKFILKNALFKQVFVYDRIPINCDKVLVDFRYRRSLSAGTASASSEENRFLRGLQTRSFPQESTALRSNQPST
jgi:hypothetical protein